MLGYHTTHSCWQEEIMTIDLVFGLIALVLPAAMFFDYRLQKKAEANPLATYKINQRLSYTLMLLAPYAILFFSDNFWINILYLVPLFLYAALLAQLAYKKGWSPVGPAMVFVTFPGSVGVTVIIYYIFFHEGVLSPDVTQLANTGIANKEHTISLWPFYIYGLLLFTQLVYGLIERKKGAETNKSVDFLFIQVLAFNILPLFTQHYWWLMLAGVIMFFAIVQSVANRMKLSSRVGMRFVLIFFYMMAATASIVLYTILF